MATRYGLSTLINVPATNVSVNLLPAAPSRAAASIWNEADQPLRVKIGTIASATSYSFIIPPGGFWEHGPADTYSGAIDGIWDGTPTGVARCTQGT